MSNQPFQWQEEVASVWLGATSIQTHVWLFTSLLFVLVWCGQLLSIRTGNLAAMLLKQQVV